MERHGRHLFLIIGPVIAIKVLPVAYFMTVFE